MELKLKDLRYLVAVADERHFGRAAAKCFVSQPTLSAQLRKLEESLGVQLIERRPRRVTLTEAGEEIAQRARTMLATGDAIVQVAQTRRDPLAGQLRVALLPTIGPYLLPQIALKLRKALPRLELMLYEYRTEPMLERLHNGDIDVGILALPVHDGMLVSRELYEEPFVLALPDSHRLAARAQVRTSDLDEETLLLLEDGHCLREQALAICGKRGGTSPRMVTTSLETLKYIVAAGSGYSLLPTLACELPRGLGELVQLRDFDERPPSRRIGLCFRRTLSRREGVTALAAFIRKHPPPGVRVVVPSSG